MKPVSLNEYLEMYNSTGLDIDGRASMFQNSIPVLSQSCYEYVQYAKKLPSFKRLSKEDQIAILKGNFSTSLDAINFMVAILFVPAFQYWNVHFQISWSE